MNKNISNPFQKANPIGKIKLLKIGKVRVSIAFLLSILVVGLILFLSTVSIADADANYIKNGDFKIGMAVSSTRMFEGDNFNLTLFLTNTSKQTQFVAFQGACQATYQIRDLNGKVVLPVNLEQTPCNNTGYEEFLIYPGQVKRYYFSVVNRPGVSPILPVGKYQIIGTIEGFGQTDLRNIEVLPRPKVNVKEGELCEGLTGRKCEQGLECRFRGGFPGGSGMCFKPDSDFKPVNRCRNGLNNCFNDVVDHANALTIERFVEMGRVSGFSDGNFRPDDPIIRADFYILSSRISGMPISRPSEETYINRDEALSVLYHLFVRDESPRKLSDSPFLDAKDSKYENYITAAYQLGVVNLNDERRFYPNEKLTRAHALVMIERFENLR